LFDRFKDTANGSASRAKVFSSVKKLQDFITELTAIPDLKNAWVLMTESTMARLKEFVASRLGNRSLRADTLQYCQTPLLVTGPPGSGKTTLLHQTAKHMMMTNVKRVTPVVLLRAADMKIFSSSRILSDALFRLGELGRPVAKEDFRNALREGEVRIFVDGLDEAGEKMHLLTAAIVDICREFPRLMVVASVRDSVAGFDWKEALRIRLQKFDAEQLNSFIWKWFAADPTRATTLCSWIQANDTLGAIARTPVNAALLCSLTDVLGKLPTTELDLYRSRLNLLLGGWEEAKNIAPMPREIRRQYELFLKTLAFEAHKRNERNFLRSLAISIAPRYMTPGYNKDANSMIDDLIRRGVLEVQVDGRLSFGHLTFQEHLAAEYMYQYRPIAFIHEHISSGWWLKPLIFLSTMMEDIGDILSSLADSSILSAKTQINTLLGYAVHTRTHPWLDRKLKLLAL
jgi:predicted NACHT family NTPase